MNKTKNGSIVNKILKDIEELHGRKEIYIKRISYRTGILNQFFETFRANLKNLTDNVLSSNDDWEDKTLEGLKLAKTDLMNIEKFVEETIKFIEDFNKARSDLNEEIK